MPRFDVVAFDADDTLWHNERLYARTQAMFAELLARYHEPEWVAARLYEAEMRNLPHFGYGIKAFALSLIETAVELTEGRVSGRDIQAIIDAAKGMLAAEVELLAHAVETLAAVAAAYPLMLVTKGDLLDQESKLARSGLAPYFRHVEIVSGKTTATYGAVLARHGIRPERFVMVGNSLRSDILPVLELGAHAVFVPHEQTWEHEAAEPPPADRPGYHAIEHLGQLPALLARLEGGDGPR